MAELPASLAISLWIVGSTWFLAIVALLFGLDHEMVWSALLFGLVAGSLEWIIRRKNRP